MCLLEVERPPMQTTPEANSPLGTGAGEGCGEIHYGLCNSYVNGSQMVLEWNVESKQKERWEELPLLFGNTRHSPPTLTAGF